MRAGRNHPCPTSTMHRCTSLSREHGAGNECRQDSGTEIKDTSGISRSSHRGRRVRIPQIPHLQDGRGVVVRSHNDLASGKALSVANHGHPSSSYSTSRLPEITFGTDLGSDIRVPGETRPRRPGCRISEADDRPLLSEVPNLCEPTFLKFLTHVNPQT